MSGELDSDDVAVDVPSAVDPQQPVKARRAASKAARERAEFWGRALGTVEGRRQVYSLMSDAGAFETIFAVTPGGQPDPAATWFRAGQREFGQRLFLTVQQAAYALTYRMMAENDHRYKDMLRGMEDE